MINRSLGRALGIATMTLLVFATNGTAQLAPSKCDSAKWKALGDHTKCRVTVEAKAAKKGGSVAPDDPAIAECADRFLTKCAKAEAGSDCSQPGTCADVLVVDQQKLDNCLNLIR